MIVLSSFLHHSLPFVNISPVLQEKDSSYVCELCQKNSQCIQPTSATEFDDSVEISEVREPEAVSTSDRIALSPLISGNTMMSSIDFRFQLCMHSLNFDPSEAV